MSHKVVCFSGWEIRALAAGHKTWFTRRMKEQPVQQHLWYADRLNPIDGQFVAVFTDSPEQGEKRHGPSIHCPYNIGEELLVGEVYAIAPDVNRLGLIHYRATNTSMYCDEQESKPWPRTMPPRKIDLRRAGGWRHPASIPQWAARWKIRVAEIRVCRLKSMDELEVLDEGFECHKSQLVTGVMQEAGKEAYTGTFIDGSPRDGFFLDRADRSCRHEWYDWMWRCRFEVVRRVYHDAHRRAP